MSRRDDDHIGHVPKITPAHDEIASFQRNQAKGQLAASLGEVPDVGAAGSASASMATKSVLTLVVLVLLATAAWAGYLHQKLQIAEKSLQNYELRIGDLERRLMVTDESMGESSAAMKVKLRELDSEVRKLWDNVWKKSKQKFAENDALLKLHTESIAASDAFIASAKQQMTKRDDVVAGLSQQLQKTQQLHSQVAENQLVLGQQEKSLENMADKTNRVSADLGKLDRRVKGTEEWVESINGFRRQVNRDLTALKQGSSQPAPQ
ncbi:hypothetical protein [Oceanicoccus sagamiensis]|uniref:Uncharacterized protein n=1 Tax=Oceanicoccus sagamiensis TaxID=716816 RepID=A0A1X9NA90_9GAMM|nr:hypothetical protein [Oceanicoccus sagamiensis]ARN72855.1 hypothetical protein BST96_01275 [Oceanicoccus sagamiensis]